MYHTAVETRPLQFPAVQRISQKRPTYVCQAWSHAADTLLTLSVDTSWNCRCRPSPAGYWTASGDHRRHVISAAECLASAEERKRWVVCHIVSKPMMYASPVHARPLHITSHTTLVSKSTSMTINKRLRYTIDYVLPRLSTSFLSEVLLTRVRPRGTTCPSHSTEHHPRQPSNVNSIETRPFSENFYDCLWSVITFLFSIIDVLTSSHPWSFLCDGGAVNLA